MEPQYVVALIMTGLGVVVLFLLRNWHSHWEKTLAKQTLRIESHDQRLNLHDIHHATIVEKLSSFQSTQDEIRADVKEILRQNGNRTAI